MFEDRNNSTIERKELNDNRTVIATEIESNKDSFIKPNINSIFAKYELKNNEIKESVINSEHTDVNTQQEVEKADKIIEKNNKTDVQQTEIVNEQLLEINNILRFDEETSNESINLKKELKSITPSTKKSYLFRIKLVTGVYCIVVALFGGWVIGNAVNIANTNRFIYDTVAETEQINSDIAEIVLELNKLDTASRNPDEDSVLVQIATETIPVAPEKIEEPTQYEKSSNWFDAICNWFAKIFGRR